MNKLNNFTGLLCVGILVLLGYQTFFANKGKSTATASFLGRRK